MKLLTLSLAAASALTLAACAETEDTDTTDTDTVAADTMANDTAMADGEMTDAGTVVEVAQGNPDFSTLVTAVTAADLAGTLSGDGPFTVFAPNNAAFDKLPDGTLETLTAPESKERLSGILTYHVVPGETNAAALTEAIAGAGEEGYTITTVNGGTLTAMMDGSDVVLTDAAGNTSRIVSTDVDASNGVIHVIDTVLMPE